MATFPDGTPMRSSEFTVTKVDHANKSIEVRTVDPKTGGEKGSKLAAFHLIPGDFLWALAEHYGRGMAKYAARNWEKGYRWGLSEDAMMRHFHQWKGGQRYDEETGSHHLIAVAWHACALYWFDMHGKGTNDIAPNLPPTS